ncbi:MAG: DUF3006 domain-containing protein [Oscillospiraceae bacterium]|nr:DUF3006 domain-containing protein [Oscillospiraceae bacterium]
MNEKYYSVSRIEEGVAIIEFPDGSFREVDLSLLPTDVKEGNILILNDNGEFIHDFQAEDERKRLLLSLQDDIFG